MAECKTDGGVCVCDMVRFCERIESVFRAWLGHGNLLEMCEKMAEKIMKKS